METRALGEQEPHLPYEVVVSGGARRGVRGLDGCGSPLCAVLCKGCAMEGVTRREQVGAKGLASVYSFPSAHRRLISIVLCNYYFFSLSLFLLVLLSVLWKV